MAALVIHTAALEFTEKVKEAVFIGGVTAQLLHSEGQMQTVVSIFHFNLTSNSNFNFILNVEYRPQTIKQD